MFKIKGILFHVGAKQVFGSNMVKKEFIISRIGGGAYPNIVFETLGDKDLAQLDAIPLNASVEVMFDVHGKSYSAKDGQAKYFNVLRSFNIEPLPVAPIFEAGITNLVEEAGARIVDEITAKPVEEAKAE